MSIAQQKLVINTVHNAVTNIHMYFTLYNFFSNNETAIIQIITIIVHTFLFHVCGTEKKLEIGIDTYIVNNEWIIPIIKYNIKVFLDLKVNMFTSQPHFNLILFLFTTTIFKAFSSNPFFISTDTSPRTPSSAEYSQSSLIPHICLTWSKEVTTPP